MTKTAKKVIFKGDGSLDALISNLCEKFKVFWTLQESGYLMEPTGVKDDLRKGFRKGPQLPKR